MNFATYFTLKTYNKKKAEMKNLIIVLIFFLTLSSCNKNSESQVSKSVFACAKKPVLINLDYSNPARMAGSNFGAFFISMLKTQNYDMALRFTSQPSIKKFGKEAILNKYKIFDFNFKLKLSSISSSQDGSKFTLKFITNEFATGKFKLMNVILENDTCKLLLTNDLEILGH